jgi:hypothetical protein
MSGQRDLPQSIFEPLQIEHGLLPERGNTKAPGSSKAALLAG